MLHAISPSVALATLIIVVGSALQASTGMGMALFAAPLLALIDAAYVPGPMLCAVMLLSATVAWRERSVLDARLLVTALLGLAIGCAVAVALLSMLAGMHLARLFAVMILAAVALSLFGARIRVSTAALLFGGAASGVLGTMSGAHGPPIALVLQNESPARLRGTLCAFFTAGCATSLLALSLGGLFSLAQLELGAALLPGVIVGFALAPLISRRLDRRRTRTAVLTISALSALALLLH
jgi:uncharacterized membrane protein YfcA